MLSAVREIGMYGFIGVEKTYWLPCHAIRRGGQVSGGGMMGRYYVHETSLIGDRVRVGDDTRIWQFCNIMDDVEIGENCNIGQNVFIESGVKLGNHVKVKNNISLYQGVECEDDVFLGPNCVFTNVNNPRSFIEKKDQIKKTIVHKGATIGANATIICGHSIGRYAFVGAGSVVTRDVKDYELVVGNPAKAIGYVCKCGQVLNAELQCTICGREYEQGLDKKLLCRADRDIDEDK